MLSVKNALRLLPVVLLFLFCKVMLQKLKLRHVENELKLIRHRRENNYSLDDCGLPVAGASKLKLKEPRLKTNWTLNCKLHEKESKQIQSQVSSHTVQKN